MLDALAAGKPAIFVAGNRERWSDRRSREALGYPNEPIYDGLPAIADYTVEIV
jgi:hypothetical protein